MRFSSVRVLLIAGVVVSTNLAGAAELVGTVDKVVDGDTFWLCDASACHKIRVCGINAPEKGETGYREASEALKSLVTGKTVRCVQVGSGTVCDGRSEPTNHDRIVAQCFDGAADIAAPLVERGFACDWIKFSGGHYSRNKKGTPCP
jgi:endonuclease YncB( thermonuclease family)